MVADIHTVQNLTEEGITMQLDWGIGALGFCATMGALFVVVYFGRVISETNPPDKPRVEKSKWNDI